MYRGDKGIRTARFLFCLRVPEEGNGSRSYFSKNKRIITREVQFISFFEQDLVAGYKINFQRNVIINSISLKENKIGEGKITAYGYRSELMATL